jgi:hypothetical protein
LLTVTGAALEPLFAIYRHQDTSTKTSPDPFIDGGLLELIEVLPEYRRYLEPPLELVQKWIAARKPQRVPTHGDYAPRNLLFAEDYSRVVGIIDWEWFSACGIAGFDALKFLLELHASYWNRSMFQILSDFLRGRRVHNFPVNATRVVGHTYELVPDDLWHLGVLIWLHLLWTGCVVTKPVSRRWLDDAVMVPAQAIEICGALQGGKTPTGRTIEDPLVAALQIGEQRYMRTNP